MILWNLTELTWLAAAGKSPLTWRVNAEICYKRVIFQQTMFDCREVSQSMGMCSRCDMDNFLENYYIYMNWESIPGVMCESSSNMGIHLTNDG
jgi:hypothetical protein